MDDFRNKVFEYLVNGEGSTRERKAALRDLVEGNFFNMDVESLARSVLTNYLDKNPRGFCPAGIARFRKAILPPKHQTVRIVLDIVTEGERSLSMDSSGSCVAIEEMAESIKTLIRGQKLNRRQVVTTVWADYDIVNEPYMGVRGQGPILSPSTKKS